MKACCRCKIEKDFIDFPKNAARKDGYGSCCKECHRKYVKAHYGNNKQYYVEKAARNKKVVQEKIRAIKKVPCFDCGVSYPHYVMDFDHRPEHEKSIEMHRAFERGWAAIQAEVDKCDVVCANCHRQRTHDRLVSKKAPIA